MVLSSLMIRLTYAWDAPPLSAEVALASSALTKRSIRANALLYHALWDAAFVALEKLDPKHNKAAEKTVRLHFPTVISFDPYRVRGPSLCLLVQGSKSDPSPHRTGSRKIRCHISVLLQPMQTSTIPLEMRL
jgi:hypothetical protein